MPIASIVLEGLDRAVRRTPAIGGHNSSGRCQRSGGIMAQDSIETAFALDDDFAAAAVR